MMEREDKSRAMPPTAVNAAALSAVLLLTHTHSPSLPLSLLFSGERSSGVVVSVQNDTTSHDVDNEMGGEKEVKIARRCNNALMVCPHAWGLDWISQFCLTAESTLVRLGAPRSTLPRSQVGRGRVARDTLFPCSLLGFPPSLSCCLPWTVVDSKQASK